MHFVQIMHKTEYINPFMNFTISFMLKLHVGRYEM